MSDETKELRQAVAKLAEIDMWLIQQTDAAKCRLGAFAHAKSRDLWDDANYIARQFSEEETK